MSVTPSVSTNMARYALIIGVAEYTGSFRSLETPVQNANAIADLLDRYGDFNQVKRLPFRREAGQKDLGKVIRKSLPNETLVRELQQFLQDVNGSDVLIYYSGHGFTKLDQLSHTPEGYLAPSDCQVELNTAGQIIAEKNGISLVGLNALINRHTFNSLVVILDCCNSGAFLESSMVRRDVTTFGYQRDYYLITACRSSSKAYEGEEYSLLTDAVLKGLSATNAAPGSGRISGDRLFDVIGNELQNSRQEPIRLGWGRMITLVRYLQPPESLESVAHPFNPANPYMGLKPFEREQAEYFFGREQAVRALLDRLSQNRFLAVIGPSGSGKSSLVRAGLLPELERDRISGSREWQVDIITPGQYPLQTLTNTLEQHHSSNKSVVLFVDQFEELFTLCSNKDEQRSFIQRLHEETNSSERQTRIIIAMRGDFLDRCAKFQESADLINSTAPTTYMVVPLTEARLVAELEDSITCPALLHGVEFEPELVSRIVDDVVNQLGAMPLLQYALAQLWDNCISPSSVSRLLTMQGYDAIGGVKGALQRWADQFYTSLPPNDQAFVKELISELVQIGDGDEVTRRRASWVRLREIANSQKQLNVIISRLVYQRLLVADDKTVEVAHEALLSESRLIKNWVEENRESIRLQQRLEIYCREWQEHDRSKDYLLDAGRLAAIDEWIEKKQPRLMSVDQEFIDKSRERRDRELQTQLEQERRLREAAETRARIEEEKKLIEIEKALEAEAKVKAEAARAEESGARAKAERYKTIATATAGAFIISTLLASLVAQQRQAKVKQSEAFYIGSLIEEAKQTFRNGQQLEAMIKVVKTIRELENTSIEKNNSLKQLQDIAQNVHERNHLKRGSLEIKSFAVSPDQELIAAASFDGVIIVWTKNGEFIKSIPVGNAVYGLSFSPDGKIIASASKDGAIRLWTKDGFLIRTFEEKHKEYASSVAFAPDGKALVSISKDGTIKLWNTNGNLIKNIPIGNPIYGLRFSPDGQLFATIGDDGILRLWSISGVLIASKKVSEDPASDISFSSDGKTVAIGSDDRTVKIWRRNNSWKDITLWKTLQGHEAPVYSVDFSKEGVIASGGSSDNKLKIWDENGFLVETFDCHSYVNYVRFTSDGNRVICATDDQSLIVWDVSVPPINNLDLQNLKAYSCNFLFEYLETNSDLEDSEVCS